MQGNTHTLSGQELGLSIRILRVNQTSRVNLDLVHIDSISTKLHHHLLTVTSSVGAVGGRQVIYVGAMLLEERIFGEIGSITTGSQDDGAVLGVRLALELVVDASNNITLVVDVGHLCFLDDLNPMGLLLGKLLQSLHQRICDSHAGELGIVTTVGSGLRMATKAGYESEIKVEDVLQPLDGGSGLVGEDLDQVWSGLVTGRFHGIVVELLHAVADLRIDLGASESAVDTGGSFSGIATEET
jgi:hypothetical protein